MRRAVPLFTVEVRRRPRLATTSNADAQSSETRFPQAGFDRASHRVAAAAFEAKKADPSPTEVASSPKGRILPSLVPDASLRRTLRDAALTPAEFDPPPQAPKRPPARTSKGKDQASKLPLNSRLSSDENAPVAERTSTTSHQTASVQSDDGARRFAKGRDDRAKSSCRRLRWTAAERKGKAKKHDRDLSRRPQGQAFA